MPENLRKEILAATDQISKDITAEWPGFSLRFVPYRRGNRQDEYERVLSEYKKHPCETAAREILREATSSPENSSFVGIAAGTEKKFMGLHNKTTYVGFAAVNIDSYSSVENCLCDIYHLTAQAIDTYGLIINGILKQAKSNAILQPKRNYLALSRNNLKSDIFSALALQSETRPSISHDLAARRAKHALIPQSLHHPENYPFVISADVMKYTLENLMNGKSHNLKNILNLSEKIALSFDKHHLKTWINFCSPAQVMAWNGFTPEEILGAAIFTSSDPYIKSTANLICEITKIKPSAENLVSNATNPYVDNDTNIRHHSKLLEDTFEVAIISAIESESHLPLVHTANKQNEHLLKGRVLGWCADALQAAARTFEQSAKKGMAPGPASRIEFQRVSSKSDWETLETLNSHLVSRRRTGRVMTFGEVINFCGSKLEFGNIMESLRMTMADPGYSAKLAYVNDQPKPNLNLAPVASPAPQPAAYAGYVPVMAPSAMGGMAGSTPVVPPKKIILADDDKK